MVKKNLAYILIFLFLSAAGVFALPAGSPLPEIKLTDFSRQPVSLTEKANGKTTLITFMSTLDQNSSKMAKILKDLRLAFPKTKLEIIAVFLTKKQKAAEKLINPTEAKITCLLDSELKTPEAFQILIIPTAYLANKDGEITNMFVDYNDDLAADLTKAINSLL